MSSLLARQVVSALAEFSSHTRLYELKFKDERSDARLLVEAFAADEQLQGFGTRDVIALSTRANIAHSSLLGKEASLEISLGARSYCCQYRETDFEFVVRLLTEEGLAWRFEQHEGSDRMVLFADSSQLSAAPEDIGSAAGGGIRYHAASALEKSDSIQYLQALRKLGVAVVTVLSYDYKTKQTVAVTIRSRCFSA